jgi:bifunctional non-homologous end joining protein LigD
MNSKTVVVSSATAMHCSSVSSLLRRKGEAVFYAFDLIWLNGEDLKQLPLVRRKERLRRLIDRSKCAASGTWKAFSFADYESAVLSGTTNSVSSILIYTARGFSDISCSSMVSSDLRSAIAVEVFDSVELALVPLGILAPAAY